MNKTEALKRMDALEDEAKELRKIIEQEDKWEPKGGDWYVMGNGVCGRFADNNKDDALSGSLFPTRSVAERASDWFTFYRRLYKLAEELNPSGKIVRVFEVYFYTQNNKWDLNMNHFTPSVATLFETEQSAKEACRIMNRDGWRLPEHE